MTHKRVNRLQTRVVLALLLGALIPAVAVAPAGASAADGLPVEAVFENQVIDLSSDWGDAQACMVWSDAGAVECFRTENAMDARIAELEAALVSPPAGTEGAQCSGYMRLYKDSGYSGQVLYLRDRLQWINLSGYSFSNETSSFKIGPCSTYLADGSWGSGSWYPTSQTQAWDVASSMASGWNDRISSVYIK